MSDRFDICSLGRLLNTSNRDNSNAPTFSCKARWRMFSYVEQGYSRRVRVARVIFSQLSESNKSICMYRLCFSSSGADSDPAAPSVPDTFSLCWTQSLTRSTNQAGDFQLREATPSSSCYSVERTGDLMIYLTDVIWLTLCLLASITGKIHYPRTTRIYVV